MKAQVTIAFTLLALVAASVAFSTNYYVDESLGSDMFNGLAPVFQGGNSGPWQSLAPVNVTSFAPGDSVLLKRGETWREALMPTSSGASGAPIVFGAYGPGYNPIISGAEVLENWTPETVGSFTAYWTALPVRPRRVLEDKALLEEVEHQLDLVPGSWWYDEIGARLYVRATSDGDPHGYLIEAGQRVDVASFESLSYIDLVGLTFEAANGDSPGARFIGMGSHWSVIDCVSRFNYRSGLKISTSGDVASLISGGEYYHNGSSGISLSSGSSALSISGITVTGVVSRENRTSWFEGPNAADGYGINSFWVDDSVFFHNTVYGNYSHGINLDGGEEGGPPEGCDFNTIERNEIYDNGKSGIELQFYCDSNVIRDNYIHGNGRNFFAAGVSIIQTSSLNEVYDNIVHGTYDGGNLFSVNWAASESNSFHHNTAIAFDNETGFRVVDDPGGSAGFGTNISNNIYVGGGKALYVSSSDVTGFVADCNCWFSSAAQEIFWQGVPLSLEAFQAQTGLDLNSFNEDPLLCDPAIGDYNLEELSPCAPANSPICGPIGAEGVGCGTVSVAPVEAPTHPGFVRIFPNPVHESTTIAWQFPVGGDHASIGLYDALGRLVVVRPLPDGMRGDGRLQWSQWIAQVSLASGMYFVEMRVDGRAVAVQRLLLIR